MSNSLSSLSTAIQAALPEGTHLEIFELSDKLVTRLLMKRLNPTTGLWVSASMDITQMALAEAGSQSTYLAYCVGTLKKALDQKIAEEPQPGTYGALEPATEGFWKSQTPLIQPKAKMPMPKSEKLMTMEELWDQATIPPKKLKSLGGKSLKDASWVPAAEFAKEFLSPEWDKAIDELKSFTKVQMKGKPIQSPFIYIDELTDPTKVEGK